MARRFPAPWTVEALDGGFKVVDGNKQTIAYVYGQADLAAAVGEGAAVVPEIHHVVAAEPG